AVSRRALRIPPAHRRGRPMSRAVGRDRTDQRAVLDMVLRLPAPGGGARAETPSGSRESAGVRHTCAGGRRHETARQVEPPRSARTTEAVLRAAHVERPDVLPERETGLSLKGEDDSISRRDLLKRAGAAAFVPIGALV